MDKQTTIKKENQYIVITKHGIDDYSIWVTEDLDNDNEGWSVRGDQEQVIGELGAEFLTEEEIIESF